MHPALRYELMQARHHDQLRAAAHQRLATEAKAARAASRGNPAAAPSKRVLRAVFRLRTA